MSNILLPVTISKDDTAGTLNHLSELVHTINCLAGWWEEGCSSTVFASKIALIHSEVSEMLEGLRKGISDDHLPHRSMEEVEAADILIRLLDYCGARRLDLEGAFLEKLSYNNHRQDHKIENRKLPGGKKF